MAPPLQTAVRRADEQAFARLNGANLMYVEDAARRVQAALAQHYAQARVTVRHMESLHPHDAVAQAGKLACAFHPTTVEEHRMPEKIAQEPDEDSLEEQVERERREHALIDEEKLGMDELEEERLKRERQPGAAAGR